MSVSMRDPSRTLLFGGVAFAAALAGAGFYLFFANVPERGAATQQVVAATPQKIERADIERMKQERNAFAPRPGEREILSAKIELAARARGEYPAPAARGEMASADARECDPACGRPRHRSGPTHRGLAHRRWIAAGDPQIAAGVARTRG